jgi:hypothetical protein
LNTLSIALWKLACLLFLALKKPHLFACSAPSDVEEDEEESIEALMLKYGDQGDRGVEAAATAEEDSLSMSENGNNDKV